jgi:2-phospho-L-lactate guanylyltransferase
LTKDYAVIPVKGLLESKSRLSGFLGAQDKRKLVLAMLKDVLATVEESDIFSRVLVVSPDRNVEREAHLQSGGFLHQEGPGLNAAIRQSTLLAMSERASSIAVLLADIPLIEPRDLREIYSVGKAAHRVVLSPSLKGGTNVMIRDPPDAISSAYGSWSFSNHLRAAQKKGVAVYAVSNQRLSFDIDTKDDLAAIARSDPGYRTRTARLLRETSILHVFARTSN